MSTETNYFNPYFLMLLGAFMVGCVLIYFWRNSALFSPQNPSSSIASCALLWAGIGLIVSVISTAFTPTFSNLITAFKLGFFESIKMGMLGIGDALFLIALPINAVYGAIFGGFFEWLNSINKASGSILQRAFIGAFLGIAVTILLTVLVFIVLLLRDNISINQMINQQYGLFIVIIWAMFLAGMTIGFTIMALITPKHLLFKPIN